MDWQYLDLADFLLVAEAVLDLPAEDLSRAGRLDLADSALHAPAAEFGRVEFGDLWIQFRPTGADEDVLDAVEQAMEAANEVMAPFDGRSDGYTCCFVGPWQSPVGTRSFHMMEDTGGEFEAITDWLDAFADVLERVGLQGAVEPLPKQDLSVTDVLSSAPKLQLTTFVAYSLDDPSPSRPFRWNVPTAATQRIVGHVAESAFGGAETILGGSRCFASTSLRSREL